MTSDFENENVDLLAGLNPVQKEAVQHVDGPVLIHAGAGSGKTRVLTHRVAYLIKHAAVRPWQILAVTFTNKAAVGMKERIGALAGGAAADAWIGTFHSISARILRVEAEKIGYERNFVIYDRDDQIRFMKTILLDLHIPDKEFPPAMVISAISRAKNDFISAKKFLSGATERKEETIGQLYMRYQSQLKKNNAMDFDDLLVNPIYLFESDENTLARYSEKFRHILVDEYQDTNRTQYLFLKKLSQTYQNLCVVGDDDQSIYRWRGADISNILNIEKDFPGCKVFRLDQNYRSTQNILDVANSVVKNNVTRREKELWTENGVGDRVVIFDLSDQISEAQFAVNKIRSEMQENARNFNEFVMLYRTNAQSRVLEDALRTAGVPYTIVGGLRFYERKEVKDVLAYLRLVCNPRDSISFKRVVNYPLRGIGNGSIRKLEVFAAANGISLMQSAARVEEVTTIAPRIRKNIRAFFDLAEKYRTLKDEFTAGELARVIVDEIAILKIFKEVGTEEALGRAENVRELLLAIVNFGRTRENAGLEAFLEEVSLISDVDNWDDASNAVTLMTIHSAKGLEFPVVFVTGLEEGLFPLSRTFLSDEEIEEERRLFYVAATRAEKKLYLTWAATRFRFGEYYQNLPSRFISEIDPELVDRIRVQRSSENRRSQLHSKSSRYSAKKDAAHDYDDFSGDLPKLYLGCEVKHAKFGLGKVVRMDGQGEMSKVTVRFYEAGEKRLLVKYANLDILV